MNSRSTSRYPRKAEIERTVAAAKASGLDVAGIEVTPDGTIRVLEARAMAAPVVTDFDRFADKL
jgi:hypothetical protein